MLLPIKMGHVCRTHIVQPKLTVSDSGWAEIIKQK